MNSRTVGAPCHQWGPRHWTQQPPHRYATAIRRAKLTLWIRQDVLCLSKSCQLLQNSMNI